MKRTLALILALLMVTLMFASCSDKTQGGETTTAPPDNVSDTPDVTTAKTPETTKKPETSKEPETTAAPEIPVPEVVEGIMVYYEDFDYYANTTGSQAVADLLGWQIRNKTMEGELGALTDNTVQYSIENGMLKLLNYDNGNIVGEDSYIKILSDEYMKPAAMDDYTIQYDVTYLASKNAKRYIVLLCNYDGYNSYNSFHLRVNGTANNQNRCAGSWTNYDVPGEFYAAADDTEAKGSSIANKLFGVTYDGSAVLYNKSLTIRYQANHELGPTVWIRDNSAANPEFVCVSKPDAGASAAFYWNMIDYYALCLKAGATIDGYVDNIAVWTGLGDMPLDVSTTTYENTIASYLDAVKKAQ